MCQFQRNITWRLGFFLAVLNFENFSSNTMERSCDISYTIDSENLEVHLKTNHK